MKSHNYLIKNISNSDLKIILLDDDKLSENSNIDSEQEPEKSKFSFWKIINYYCCCNTKNLQIIKKYDESVDNTHIYDIFKKDFDIYDNNFMVNK